MMNLLPPAATTPLATTIDPVAVLAELSTDEKIELLSGRDMWHTASIERLGVPSARMSDGPNGVRGVHWSGGSPASCFPAATALGASFDIDLVRRVGEALGDECRARGVHCLLGPTTNIQRSPLGGRGFESYGEDPFLSGTMGASWMAGVQSRKVMTTPKHFVANEQEFKRRLNNSVVDERTLAEIYLEPFRTQCKANPSGFMSSYNRVNGTHASESAQLLRKILRQDFEFKGLIVSDWSGTYSSSPSIMRGLALQRDLTSGKLTIPDLDECALPVLRFVKEAMESGIPFDAVEESIDNAHVRALLRESAQGGIVLLKNAATVLPLRPTPGTKVAVIGPNANKAMISGGGSASLRPTYTVAPLDAITAASTACGAEVFFEVGANTSRWSPLLGDYLQLPAGVVHDNSRIQLDFYDANPHLDTQVVPRFTKYDESSYSYFIDGIPSTLPVRGWVILRTVFTPDVDGVWEFGLGVAGQAKLLIDDQLVVANEDNQVPGMLFFGTGSDECFGLLDVRAGQQYKLEIHFSNFKAISPSSPYAGRRGGVRLGGQPKYDSAMQIQKEITLSRNCDITILVVGTTAEWESESYDRDDMKLPLGSDMLVSAILDATPNAIVVSQSGMPLEFPWLSRCSTLIQAFFGGNECGQAIADTIFGVNPSGKLPITFPRVLEDCPSQLTFGHPTTTVYSEGIKVGYRHLDHGGPASAFPFGFGLSYTIFAFSDLVVAPLPSYGLSASFTITNTGSVAGAEVARVYLHDTQSRVERPEVELKGFAKVFLEPGEAKRTTITMDHSALSYYDVSLSAWVGEKGVFEVRVGPSSVSAALAAPFIITESFSWIGQQLPVKCDLF